MPEFHAVQCFQCQTFQVQQVKKVAKFSCSLCGCKQSVRKAYAISAQAKDIRLVVQQLNLKRQKADEQQGAEREADITQFAESPRRKEATVIPENLPAWDDFLETEEGPQEDQQRTTDSNFVTQLPDAKRQKRANTSQNNQDAPPGGPGHSNQQRRAEWTQRLIVQRP
ncbi:hypothetical protein WJX72_004434 [[Myrmecia] bisecta]|uniref:MRN complex-interacting protein N-terminal domain-containing protein n=1 Tax=[Myrmecia] bisecta TaxID=41462 RepID=A0AAW1PDG2_9CHLO